uniref:Uncharacterized protein n=1 Tax=Nelumbo nucifera TaxID=4432 RepID=A0A822ZFS8_NELNU|nr:TPA_asm: hypothetical protein HUJ06_016209 [Nelumbo nucifera]
MLVCHHQVGLGLEGHHKGVLIGWSPIEWALSIALWLLVLLLVLGIWTMGLVASLEDRRCWFFWGASTAKVTVLLVMGSRFQPCYWSALPPQVNRAKKPLA